jgi:hypothetical protein
VFDIQVLVLQSIGKKPKATERGSNVLHRHTPRDFGYAETFQIMEQGWGESPHSVYLNLDSIGKIISFHQPLPTDITGAADGHPDTSLYIDRTSGTSFLESVKST